MSHHTDVNWNLSTSETRTANAGIWAAFLNALPYGIGAGASSGRNCHYTAESIKTQNFAEDPSADYISLRCSDLLVKGFIKNNNGLRRKPVYIVTGIKITKEFALREDQTSETNFAARAGGLVAPAMFLGRECRGGQGGYYHEEL
jgi:hypothetical protein